MIRFYKRVLGFIVTIVATAVPILVSAQDIPKAEEGKALVIFMRPSNLGGLIKSVVYDVTTDENKIVGILPMGKKIAYNVDPGEHNFMVVAENADFMAANLEAGKTYYSVAKIRYGALTARFSLFPVRKTKFDGEEFKKWNAKTELVDTRKKSEAWAKKKSRKVQKKRDKYHAKWMQKSDSDKATYTLNKEDGLAF